MTACQADLICFSSTRQSDGKGRCTSPWVALARGKLCRSTTRRRIATMKRYTRREVAAAVLTAGWERWADAAVEAVDAEIGNGNEALHGRGVCPHAQNTARTICPLVPPRSHSSNPVRMKVRLTSLGNTQEVREQFYVQTWGSKSTLVYCQSKQNSPASAESYELLREI